LTYVNAKSPGNAQAIHEAQSIWRFKEIRPRHDAPFPQARSSPTTIFSPGIVHIIPKMSAGYMHNAT
jgi:hypothetical protein